MLNSRCFSLPHPTGWLDKIDKQPEGFLIEGWAFIRNECGAFFPGVVIYSDWGEIGRVDSANVQRLDVLDAFRDTHFDGYIGFLSSYSTN